MALWVMVAALALRALVPAGFMPDAGALRDGRIQLAFCTAGGDALSVPLDVSTSGKTRHDQAAPADCPFGMLAAQAAIVPPAMLSAIPVVGAATRVRHHAGGALPPLPAHGPPLGSRAPPSNFG